MALMTWNTKLSVGVTRIDQEHQALINLLNQLHDEMLKGRAKDVLGPTLDKLIAYTQTHFATEENLFRVHAYPSAAPHIAEHTSFRQKAVELQQSLKAGTGGISTEVMNFMRDWLTRHIQGTDMQYKAFFETKGVK